MSNVKIEGNASGTGTFTIAAPNSNTDRTFNLPDEAGTVLTNSSSINTSQLAGTGNITTARVYRVNLSFSGSSGTISSNWEEADTDGAGGFGSSPTVDGSGVWTFPSTGYWLIDYKFRVNQNVDLGYMEVFLEYTGDNGTNWSEAANGITGWGTRTSGVYSSAIQGKALFDITDTANQKLRITYAGSASLNFEGNSGTNANHLSFMRIGDT